MIDETKPVDVALMRELLNSARRNLPYFHPLKICAKETVFWFLCGRRPNLWEVRCGIKDFQCRQQPAQSIKWRRVAQPIITELDGEIINIAEGGNGD